MKIVCLGSSSVEGIGDRKGYGWAGRLSNYLQDGSDISQYRVFNLGLKGDFLSGTIKRYESEALLRRPHLVIIFTGSNDCVTHTKDSEIVKSPNSDKYIKLWDEFLPILKNAGHKTLVLGPTMVNEKLGPLNYKGLEVSFKNKDLVKYNEHLKELCNKHEIEFLELFELFEDNIEEFSFDLVHPNENGYDLIFSKLITYLKEKNHV